MKVAVTDYVEDNLDWEAEQLKKAGIDFTCFQLKFKPEEEVLERIADADIIVVNMVAEQFIIGRNGFGNSSGSSTSLEKIASYLLTTTNLCKSTVVLLV